MIIPPYADKITKRFREGANSKNRRVLFTTNNGAIFTTVRNTTMGDNVGSESEETIQVAERDMSLAETMHLWHHLFTNEHGIEVATFSSAFFDMEAVYDEFKPRYAIVTNRELCAWYDGVKDWNEYEIRKPIHWCETMRSVEHRIKLWRTMNNRPYDILWVLDEQLRFYRRFSPA